MGTITVNFDIIGYLPMKMKKTAINRTVGSASDSISVGSMAVVPGTLFIDYIVGTYPFDGSTLGWHTM